MYQMAHLIWTCGLVASPVGVILDYCTTVHVAVQEYWTSALLKVLFLPVPTRILFEQNTKIFRKRETFGINCYHMG